MAKSHTDDDYGVNKQMIDNYSETVNFFNDLRKQPDEVLKYLLETTEDDGLKRFIQNVLNSRMPKYNLNDKSGYEDFKGEREIRKLLLTKQ